MYVSPAYPLLWRKKISGKLFYPCSVNSCGITGSLYTAPSPPSGPTKVVSHLHPLSEPQKTGLSTEKPGYS
jgi:hypothetical protein